jgi:hypothetical protein
MAEKLPYVSAFLKHDRAAAREELWSMAVQAYQDDPETELTAGELVGRYEAGLAQRYGWIAPRPAAATPKSQVKPEAERKPPTSLSASRTAAPTQGRTEPASEEDLIADAAAYLESLKHA